MHDEPHDVPEHHPVAAPRRRVVVGYDGSAAGVQALRWAARESRAQGAVLHIVVAWQERPGPHAHDTSHVRARATAHDALRLLRRTDPELEVDSHQSQGAAGAVLVRHSRGAELVVLGTRGHLGVVGAAMGSVSRFVLMHTDVPVVLIGPRAVVAVAEGRVVVPATDSQLDPALVSFVRSRLSRTPAPTLHVVDTVEPPHQVPGVVDDAAVESARLGALELHEQLVEQLVEQLGRLLPEVTITHELVEGRARDVLDAALRSSDLLLVPANEREERPSLRSAPCPVAFIPEPRPTAVTTRTPQPDVPRQRSPGEGVRS